MRRLSSYAAWLLVLVIALLTGEGRGAPIKSGDKPDKKNIEFPDDIDSEALIVAHLPVGDVWNGPLFKDVFEMMAKTAGGKELLRDLEKSARKENGFWLGDYETFTFCFPMFPRLHNIKETISKVIYVVTSAKPIDKDKFLNRDGQIESPRKGFIGLKQEMLLHFPDDRTAVVVSESLADRYLAGYAKNKTGWPMSKAFKKAAERNTLVVAINPASIPVDLRERIAPQASALLGAKHFILAGNLVGNEIRLELRASFLTDAGAKKAQEELTTLTGQLISAIAKMFEDKRQVKESGIANLVAAKALQWALKDIKIDLFGSDLVVKTVYQADFPIEKIVVEMVEKETHRRRTRAKPGKSEEYGPCHSQLCERQRHRH